MADKATPAGKLKIRALPRRKIIALAGLCVGLGACIPGCTTGGTAPVSARPERHFDAYLTWRDYEKPRDAETAMFIYDGEEVGRGRDGLRAVAGRIMALPPDSVLLIYPAYRWSYFTDDALAHLAPYASYHDGSRRAFQNALDARRVHIYESDVDHLGNRLGPPWYQEKFNMEDSAVGE